MYRTILGWFNPRRSSISFINDLKWEFFSGLISGGSSKCLTATNCPVDKSPLYTLPKAPLPIRSPFFHLNGRLDGSLIFSDGLENSFVDVLFLSLLLLFFLGLLLLFFFFVLGESVCFFVLLLITGSSGTIIGSLGNGCWWNVGKSIKLLGDSKLLWSSFSIKVLIVGENDVGAYVGVLRAEGEPPLRGKSKDPSLIRFNSLFWGIDIVNPSCFDIGLWKSISCFPIWWVKSGYIKYTYMLITLS